MLKFKIKPNKARDYPFFFRVLYCFLWCTAVLSIIYSFSSAMGGGKLFTFKHFFIFLLCCIPLSIIYAIIIEKFGNRLSVLMSGWSDRKIPQREQYSADLANARFSKSRGDFSKALVIINEVIENNPEFPDALFLKAQIEWEGFKSSTLARKNLDKAIELVKDDDPLRRLIANYYIRMIKERRE